MKNNSKTYTFYSDGGHGWLKVSAKELMDLDLLSKISYYSYMSPSGKWVYLEEDCDLTKYLIAIGKGHEWFVSNVKNKYSDRSSIRSYPNINRDFILYTASQNV